MEGRLLAPLRSADYRRLWLGQLVSVVGDKVNQIALALLVYQLTGSELQMGITLAISMLPAALFGMIAGAYVDRWDKRRTMVLSDVIRAGLVLAVPFLAQVSVLGVYAVAFLVSAVALFFEPAKLSLMPELVPHDGLMAANSLDSATVSTAELLGLVFAGVLVEGLGYRVAFIFDAGTFLLSAALILRIRHRSAGPAPTAAVPWSGAVRDAVEGLGYVWRHPVLRDLLAVYALATTGVAASVTFLYALALDRFQAGASGLAALDGAITIGLLVGSIAVGRADPSGPARKLLSGLLAFGALVSLSAITPSIVWTAAVFFAAGIANMYFFIPMATILQTDTEPAMRGRAFAAKQTLSRLLSVVGFVGAGALAEGVGLSPAIVLAGALVVLVAAFGWTRPLLRAA